MRFKLDENVPYDAVAAFADGGHDVHTIPDEDLVGHVRRRGVAPCVLRDLGTRRVPATQFDR